MMRPMLIAGILVLSAACARQEASPEPEPTPARTDWIYTRRTVERLVLEARYAEADSVLASFQVREGELEVADPDAIDTLAALESRYHRVLIKADPANPFSSSADALAAIDQFLAVGSGQRHYQEALLLRRLVGEIQSLQNLPRPAPIVLGDTALLRQRSEEVVRLRDSLSRTSTELERIRRRLRSTRPDEPPPAPSRQP